IDFREAFAEKLVVNQEASQQIGNYKGDTAHPQVEEQGDRAEKLGSSIKHDELRPLGSWMCAAHSVVTARCYDVSEVGAGGAEMALTSRCALLLYCSRISRAISSNVGYGISRSSVMVPGQPASPPPMPQPVTAASHRTAASARPATRMRAFLTGSIFFFLCLFAI